MRNLRQLHRLSSLLSPHNHCNGSSARQPGPPRIAWRRAHSASSATASAAAASSSSSTARRLLPAFAGLSVGLACGTAAALAPSSRKQQTPALPSASGIAVPASPSAVRQPEWGRQLAAQPGVVEVMSADVLRSHAHPLLSEDHMFSALVKHDMVQELSCLYSAKHSRFHSILTLGKDICGYKRIVHGGLTAAVCDETFGGLLFALRKTQQLPFWGPAFTAQLDITYRARIPSESSVLCTAEVESIEGRKVWMRAVVSDGPTGKVYATARALFVAPKPQRLIQDGLRVLFPQLLWGRQQ